MINTHKLELPLSRTYFHGSKGVRAIEIRLYYKIEKFAFPMYTEVEYPEYEVLYSTYFSQIV